MSNERSPREVCSITIGISGLKSSLLASGGPQFRLGLRLFLFGRPDRFARLGELDRDALDLGGHAVECCAQAQILAQALEGAAFTEGGDRLVGILVALGGLLANHRLDLTV